jgi:signal recognition particle receptor subunit beta
MVLFNYATRELTAKIVYYGPGLCGKTTNLEWVHKSLPDKTRGKMLSLATQTDRTLFFDFLPIDLGQVKGMKTRVQLYTVPGQVFYDATRKLVLKGADGIVFVCDSQKEMLESNLESWENLKENLRENNLEVKTIPIVIQYNKRDLPNVMSVKDLNKKVNDIHAPHFEAVALNGKGVQETLKGVTKLVLQLLQQKYLKEEREPKEETARPAVVEEKAPPPPASVEEIKELPAVEELETADSHNLRLETITTRVEEPTELEELEEMGELEEYHPPEPAAPAAEASIVEPLPEEPPLQLIHDEQAVIQTGPLPRVIIEAARSATIAVSPTSQEDVSIPVEVSLGKDGQEIKLQISINLKIRVLP